MGQGEYKVFGGLNMCEMVGDISQYSLVPSGELEGRIHSRCLDRALV